MANKISDTLSEVQKTYQYSLYWLVQVFWKEKRWPAVQEATVPCITAGLRYSPVHDIITKRYL